MDEEDKIDQWQLKLLDDADRYERAYRRDMWTFGCLCVALVVVFTILAVRAWPL